MSFKPESSGNTSGAKFEDTSKLPTPRAGSRKARISLIVDLGKQNREDYEDPVTKEVRAQKPAHQVAVFADLVADVVDYGGKIGKAQYRLMLNKQFMGQVQGVNFQASPPKDAKGNTVAGKPWCLHPANLLAKLFKAVGKAELANDDRNNPNSMDINLLLNEPVMCQVEVKETEGKKEDADGNKIVYKNVNFKGVSEIPEDDDGAKIAVAALTQKARCITFSNATADDIQYIRANLIAQIKLANNYAGSQMQKAIEAYEAANGGAKAAAKGSDDDEGDEEEEKPAAKPAAAKKPAAPKKPSPPVGFDDLDDDIPF